MVHLSREFSSLGVFPFGLLSFFITVGLPTSLDKQDKNAMFIHNLKRGWTRKSTTHVALGVTDLREICTSQGSRPKNSPRELFLEFGARTVALGPILA